MIEIITQINQVVNDFIWGLPAMVCILGVGLLHLDEVAVGLAHRTIS